MSEFHRFAIVPWPRKLLPRPGRSCWGRRRGSRRRRSWGRVAAWFRDQLRPATGLPLPIAVKPASGVGVAGSADVVLAIDAALAGELGGEGYRLLVDPTGVTVHARRAGGGVPRAADLPAAAATGELPAGAPARGVTWQAPAVAIEDRPRFGWRGSHLDVARHFQPEAVPAQAPGPDGAAQAERVPLAPDRRSGLALADREVPPADRGGRLAEGQRPGAAAAAGSRTAAAPGGSGASPTAAATRQEDVARGGAVRRRTLHHGGAGDRDARPRPGGHRRVPRAGQHRAGRWRWRPPGACSSRSSTPRSGRWRFLQDVLEEVLAIFPVGVHPRGRRRGAQAGVAAERGGAGPDARAGPARRGSAAELVHRADGGLAGGARAAAGGLGRDPAGRAGARGDGDGLAGRRAGGHAPPGRATTR